MTENLKKLDTESLTEIAYIIKLPKHAQKIYVKYLSQINGYLSLKEWHALFGDILRASDCLKLSNKIFDKVLNDFTSVLIKNRADVLGIQTDITPNISNMNAIMKETMKELGYNNLEEAMKHTWSFTLEFVNNLADFYTQDKK